jgi:hypothetical protein
MHSSASAASAIVASLNETWFFLSGEQRVFIPIEPPQAPAYVDKAYYLHVDVSDRGAHYLVSVLMQRNDAVTVASHMLGIAPQTLVEGDLIDAMAEACNVITSRKLLKLSEEAQIKVGRSGYLLPEIYAQTCATGRLDSGFSARNGDNVIHVLVFQLP